MLDALTFDAGSTLTPDYMLMLDSRDSGVLHQSGYWSGRYLHGNAGQSVRF